MDEPPRFEPVRDLDDPRLADYRNLKDAELRANRGRFIVEGRGNAHADWRTPVYGTVAA